MPNQYCTVQTQISAQRRFQQQYSLFEKWDAVVLESNA